MDLTRSKVGSFLSLVSFFSSTFARPLLFRRELPAKINLVVSSSTEYPKAADFIFDIKGSGFTSFLLENADQVTD